MESHCTVHMRMRVMTFSFNNSLNKSRELLLVVKVSFYFFLFFHFPRVITQVVYTWLINHPRAKELSLLVTMFHPWGHDTILNFRLLSIS